jgi:hypothetical protein
MTADAALFQSHLEEVAFRSGMDRGRWGFPSGEPQIAWPHCILWVQADTRFVDSGRVILRFTLNGYPSEAPAAVPWDVERSAAQPNDKWPKGPGNVSAVFKPGWNNTGLYCPCDRVARSGHEAWKTKAGLGQWWWTSDSNITLYLEFVHRCLNPRDYEN